MLVLVPTIKTSFTVFDFTKAFIAAWYKLYGVYPNKKSIAVIYGQWGVETGVGQFCWNWNIGNSKVVDIPGKEIKYVALVGVWEIVNGRKII